MKVTQLRSERGPDSKVSLLLAGVLNYLTACCMNNHHHRKKKSEGRKYNKMIPMITLGIKTD